MQHPPNSEDYWDMMFTHTWEARRGREQTVFFTNVAIDYLPSWFRTEINNNPYHICDVGCALGDGVDVLTKAFPHTKITGLDFSQEAINKAKQYYPHYDFAVGDIVQVTDKYDVIFSSNTLEHFHDPFPIFHKLLQQASHYVILLLPFQDDTGTYEHFFRFDYEHFPEKIEDSRLAYLKEIDCRCIANTHWNAKQILVIYKKERDHAGCTIKTNTFHDRQK